MKAPEDFDELILPRPCHHDSSFFMQAEGGPKLVSAFREPFDSIARYGLEQHMERHRDPFNFKGLRVSKSVIERRDKLRKIEINRQQRPFKPALEITHFHHASAQPVEIARARPFVLFAFRVIDDRTADHAPIPLESVAKPRLESALLAGREIHRIRVWAPSLER